MDVIPLPPIPIDGTALITVLGRRRSRREFSAEPLGLEEIALLLWAAHGVTSHDGRRTAPSAGFTDPSIVTAVTPDWTGRYRGDLHHVEVERRADLRPDLAAAAGQEVLASAGLVISIAATLAKTAARYGARAARYVALEAGHIAQNVLLAAESSGLSAVPVGSFDDAEVARILAMDSADSPLYLIAVGRPA